MQLQRMVKRGFDIVVCTIILVVGFPVFLLLALLSWIASRGPFFFIQERAGLHGSTFRMYKFRSMRGTTTNPERWTHAEEQRITPVGRFLRNYGLDELPQVLNILKGDMSIIGPRPPLPTQAETFTPEQRGMFEMRPGVLSWVAIMGRRSMPMDSRWNWHAFYVRRWSLWLDFIILIHSLIVVLGKQNVNEIVVPTPADTESKA